MNFMTLPKKAVKVIGFGLKKHSPEILLGLGVTFMVAAPIVAVKRAPKAKPIKDKHDANVAQIEKELSFGNGYTKKDATNDRIKVEFETIVGYSKVFGPVIVLVASGGACILSAFGIIKGRNAALMATANMLYEENGKIRQRAKEMFGEEKAKELMDGIVSDDDIPPFDVYDENGNVIGQTKGALFDKYKDSPFQFIFDELNPNWTKDPTQNRYFLERILRWGKQELDTTGFVTVATVAKWLGVDYKMSPELLSDSMIWGWTCEEWGGSGVVDIGLHDVWNPQVNDFQNGYERSVVLNFHPDGIIWDKVGRRVKDKPKKVIY